MNIERAIRSTRVVTPEGERPAAILVASGKIVEVVAHDAVPIGLPLDDWGNLAILPGLVDTHVHCNEPGRTEWEGFETATKSAIAGGITTIVDMPLNSSPVTTTVDAFQQKLAATAGKLWCDVGFWGGVVPGNETDIQPLIDAGVLGFKTFLCHSGIDDFPNATADDLRQAMPIIAKAGIPLLAHCELVESPPSATSVSNVRDYQTWLDSRPPAFENRAIALLIDLCRQTECRTHVVHLADAGSLEILREAKREGLPITAETCPHYLHFSATEIPTSDTLYKCAPPIRDDSHRRALWNALLLGELDLIASDHSPCPPAMKHVDSADIMGAWGGIASLQLGPAIVWTDGAEFSASLEDLAFWMAERPAHLAGLQHRKGLIAAGKDADLMVFDTDGEWVVNGASLFHRHKLTPYEGVKLRGFVAATYLRGDQIYCFFKFNRGMASGRTILRMPF